MPVSYSFSHDTPLFDFHIPIAFVVLIFGLLFCLTLLFTSNVSAKIHVWKDDQGKRHLTNRPPPQEYTKKFTRNYEKIEKKAEPAPQLTQDVQQLVNTVEIAFQKKNATLILDVYAFPGDVFDSNDETLAKESVKRSLQMFFNSFGAAGKFKLVSAEELPPNAVQKGSLPAGCTPQFLGYGFPLPESNAAGLVYLTICGTGKQARLSAIAYELKEPTPEQEEKLADITRAMLNETTSQLAAQIKENSPETKPAAGPAAGIAPQQPPKPGAQILAQPQNQPLPGSQEPQTSPGFAGMQQHPGAASLPGMNALPMGLSPFALLQMASMFTGMALLIQTVVSFLFYFFMSLCIYLIARKTDTRGAWLSWVPILQVFPMIESSGIAWWWGLVIYFVPFPLMLIPVVGLFVMVLWFLAMIIFFVIVWMRICERLGMNKWLGLVMFIPLFNIVLLALLAFSCESTGPEVRVKSIVGRTVLAFLLCTTITCGALYLFVMPLFDDLISQAGMQGFNIPATSQQIPSVQPPGKLQQLQNQSRKPAQKKSPGAQENSAVSLDKVYYEVLFQKKPPNFADDFFEKERPETCVGPACVLLSTFWEQQDPHVWLKIRIPEVPYMTMFDSSSMNITDVLDKNGKNVYDRDSNFESGHFMALRFTRHSSGCLEAIRDVHLQPGVKEGDLGTVSGELTLLFPLNVRIANFSSNDLGQAKTIAGMHITLQTLQGNNFKIQIAGDVDRFIGVKAFDSSGNELDLSSSSSMSSENGKHAGYSFKGQITSVKAFAAEKIMKKSYAVTLKNS